MIRPQKNTNYVIYNDASDVQIQKDTLSALSNYAIRHIPWSQKQKFKEEFSLN